MGIDRSIDQCKIDIDNIQNTQFDNNPLGFIRRERCDDFAGNNCCEELSEYLTRYTARW